MGCYVNLFGNCRLDIAALCCSGKNGTRRRKKKKKKKNKAENRTELDTNFFKSSNS